jgi:hypothetical protein
MDWNICYWILSDPSLRYYVDWKGCDRKLSRPILGTIWIGTVVNGFSHDRF